jgi:hypothetical protein
LKRTPSHQLAAAAAEISEETVRETISNIVAEAGFEADLLGTYLSDLVDHLRAIGCTTRNAVLAYVAAMDQVLAELHLELRTARPSPTRVKQLVARYALDPRMPITVPAHHIQFRARPDGFEIAVVPHDQTPLTSLPYPGCVVRSRPVTRLIELVSGAEPRFSEMMELIETLLGYVPAGNHVPVTATSSATVRADSARSCVIIGGVHHKVDLQILRFVQALIERPGMWVSSSELKRDSLFAGVRFDRLYGRLPEELRALIESCPGKGYRLRLESLA